MPLASGDRLGPYEIVSPLGAGGMGEVYRARDSKLKREVAIKVLPADVAGDRERLARFQREAEVLASLNHPHIAQVFGIENPPEGGHHSAALVMELVEGEDLSQRIARGPIPIDEALPIAKQIAEALEAAHDAGIIHRDLKPANIKVRDDGTVKVLDFGLAKAFDQDLKTPRPQDLALSPTITSPAMTMRGVILGTAAYMAPEQAKGKAVDRRADIWAFGCVLYEMLTGKRAFKGDDVTDIITSVMRDTPDWSALPAAIPPGVRATLRRCLEKDPRRRLRDVGDADLSLDDPSIDARAAAPAQQKRVWPAVAAAAMLTAGLATGWLGAQQFATPHSSPVSYQRVTFQRGSLHSARFDRSGREVYYSASWDGQPVKLFSTRLDSNEIDTPNLPAVDVLSVSQNGELLVLQKPADQQWKDPFGETGTLLRSSRGGLSRPIANDVLVAAWMPDGDNAAIVRRSGTGWSIERPIGTVVRQTSNLVNSLLVSPDGNWLALAEKATGYGSSWAIVFIDRDGNARVFDTGRAGDFFDSAWAPGSNEIWFNVYQGGDPEWRAMDTAGVSRLLLRTPMPMRILDVSPEGRVLAARTNSRYGVMGLAPGEERERDFSWMDSTEIDGMSADGQTLLLTEFGEGVAFTNWSVGLRNVAHPGVVRLGNGQAFALSSDGKWALAMRQGATPNLVLIPTGAGAPVELPSGNAANFTTGSVSADGSFIVFGATEKGMPLRFYKQSVKGGLAEAVTPADRAGEFDSELGSRPISPDGKTLAVVDRDGRIVLFALDGPRAGQPRIVPHVSDINSVQRWSIDGCCVYVKDNRVFPANVLKVEVVTGRSTIWRHLDTIDPVGMLSLYAIQIADDDRSYYYTFNRVMSDLFIVEGVR